MSFIPSRKRLRRPIGKIWNWLAADTDNWEVTTLNEPLHNSAGNVFIDLGFPVEEAVIMQMRSNLMIDVIKVIESKDLTEAQAAEMLGISQARVSDLLSRKWEEFSLEMLITVATRAGMRVSINLAA
jgi:predicted XRE-type DNA-binding protein